MVTVRDVHPDIENAIERALSRAPKPDEWQLAIVAHNLRPVVATDDAADREMVTT
jgi:hypothetical protein